MTTKTPSIELKPVAWLKPYQKNAKLHPADQVKRLAATIRAHGWDQPIVCEPDGTIIKGHGRRLAAIELGLDQVPVIVRHDLTPEQAAAARIADNAAASLQYDTAVMQEEIRRLMDEVPNLNLDDFALTEKEKTLLTDMLMDPTLDAVMEDTSAEIEAQKAEDKAAAERADAEVVPAAKALGFKSFRIADQRVLTAFMAEAEAASGKQGYEAFIEGLKTVTQRGLI